MTNDANVRFRTELNAHGFSDQRLGAMCRRNDLRRIRPGAFVDPADYALATMARQHRLNIDATIRALHTSAAVSHVSAAVMHGLPLWGLPLTKVHLTRQRHGGGSSNRHKVMHALPLADNEITRIDGIAVTSLARTIIDVARIEHFEPAVIMGDHALNTASLTEDDLVPVVDGLRGRKGSRHAIAALATMDMCSESVGETRCRLALHRLGIPPSSLQRVARYQGRFVGRVDFAYEDQGIIGEFDGLLKYKLDGLAADERSGALAKEKAREEALRGLGLQVFRVVWEDLSRPSVIRHKFEMARALAAGSPAPLWDPRRPGDGYRSRRWAR